MKTITTRASGTVTYRIFPHEASNSHDPTAVGYPYMNVSLMTSLTDFRATFDTPRVIS